MRVTVHPGSHGIQFRCGAERVAATPSNVTDTTRCTRIGSISTVEHLMSALAGLEITDADVELDAPELPALDGSALEWVQGLREAGTEELGEAERPALFARVFEKADPVTVAIARGEGRWKYVFETEGRWPGHQEVEFSASHGDYEREIAPARTFAFEEEVGPLRVAGLGQGLDETTALVLGIEGPVNSARFSDEPARHKLLDLLGDLYLAGIPIRYLDVVAERSGHTANVRAANKLSEACSEA